MSQKYFIKTYGCQMNVNDSEVLAGLLEGAGYKEAAAVEKADVILLNTCCVRQRAEDKAFGYAWRLREFKEKKPGKIIGICGCIAEKDKNDLLTKLPFVDLVVGPGQEGKIVELLKKLKNGSKKVTATGEFCGDYPFQTIKRKKTATAYVRIMVGCNNFCSFCIVPYVRGREISRTKEDILQEINDLDKKTFKEVVLLGQNVNSYQGNGLAELLKDVSKIKGVERIRFLTSHPRDMRADIIDAVRSLPKVCEYFHLPLQSGDDEILKKMNRGYTIADYRRLVDKIRSKIPEVAITSDVIAGFPGETDKQFANSLKAVKEIGFDIVNTLAYDPRPGTAAVKMAGQLPLSVRKERLQRLMKVVEDAAYKKNQSLVGQSVEVLVDTQGSGQLIGRTRTNKVVKFSSPKNLHAQLIKVKIKAAKSWVLQADLLA